MQTDINAQQTATWSNDVFSQEVLFRVKLTPNNIDLFKQAVLGGLIYDGSPSDLRNRLALLEERINERHKAGQDYARLEQEEDLLYDTLTYMEQA